MFFLENEKNIISASDDKFLLKTSLENYGDTTNDSKIDLGGSILRLAISPAEKYAYVLISGRKEEEDTNATLKSMAYTGAFKEKVILKFDLMENKVVNKFKCPEGKNIMRMMLLGSEEDDHYLIMTGDFGIVKIDTENGDWL